MDYKNVENSKMKRIEVQTNNTEEFNDEDKQTLKSFENLILKENEFYSQEEIKAIYEFIIKSKVIYLLEPSHVKLIISKMNFQNLNLIYFEILKLLTVPSELSFEVFQDFFIENNFNFQPILTMDINMQNQLVAIVSNILYDNNETIDYFINNFAYYFFEIFTKELNYTYEIENLDDYFNLTYNFLPSINDQDTLMKIVHVFYIQIYNSNTLIQINALVGLYKIKRISYIINENYHNDRFFYKRLNEIGKYQSNASIYACYLFELFLNDRDILFIDDCYLNIYDLIVFYLDLEKINNEMRTEVIYMASIAIVNNNFRRLIDIEKIEQIMKKIISKYQSFSSSEKQKTIYFLAYFIDILPIEIIETYFYLDDFIDILVTSLDIIDDSTICLIRSIYSIIKNCDKIFLVISENEDIIQCLKANLDNQCKEVMGLSSELLKYISSQ